MPETKRIVLGGGPGTGKTSIIEELEKRGFRCYHEISRQIIKEQMALQTDVLPWLNLDAFSGLVIEERINQYNDAMPGINFYDRTFIDSLAYYYKDKKFPPKQWMDLAKQNLFYKNVFITAPWRDIFINDHERRETWEQLVDLHRHFVFTYEKFGYNVIIIPEKSIEERADFVLENIHG